MANGLSGSARRPRFRATSSLSLSSETIGDQSVPLLVIRSPTFAAGVRSYDRLFKTDHPEGLEDLNTASKVMSMAQLEPSLENPAQTSFQFERHGYFVVDSRTPRVYNRTVTLRDSWASANQG